MSDDKPTRGTAPAAAGARRTGALARPLLALLAAAVCAILVVMLVRTAVGTASGQRMDQLILSGARGHEGRLSQYAEIAVGMVSVPVMAGLLAIAVVLVLVRRQLSLLLPLVVLVLCANLTTQIVKRVLVAREVLGPDIEITPNSFPSGHTTLAATAMIAVVLASGRARVVLAPLGAVWTAAAGIGTLVLGWHRPSDVIGAILIAAAWTFLVLAADGFHSRSRLARAAARPGHGRRRREDPGLTQGGDEGPLLHLKTGAFDKSVAALLGVVGLAGLAYGAFGLLTLQLPLELQDAAQQTEAFIATAALIGGGTAAYMALVLLLRTPMSHRTRSDNRVP